MNMTPLSLDATLQAARAHLPVWVSWAPLAQVPIAFLAGLILTSLVALIALAQLRRIPPDAHWTERARRVYPARRALNLTLGLSALASLLLSIFSTGALFPLPPRGLAVAAALAAYLGGLGPAFLASRRIRQQPVRMRDWCRWLATSWLLLGSPLLIAAAAFALLPDELNVRAGTILLLAGGLLLWLLFGGPIQVARALGLVKPPSPRLSAAAETAAARVGTRPAAVYEIDLGRPNAAAWPPVGTLLVSREALAILDDEELAGLCAHELGHLSESRATSFARLLPGLLLLGLAALPVLGHTLGWPHLALLVLFFAMTVLQRLWRRMEQRSDRVAVENERDSGAFARAIEKGYELSLVPAVMSGKPAIHPHLYDRLLAAGVTPTYSRPKPPSQVILRLTWLGIGVPTAMAVFAIIDPSVLAQVIAPRSETAIHWRLALLPHSAWDLGNLARLRAGRGDNDSAIAFAQAATRLDASWPYYPADLAIYLARGGRCAEAEQAMTETNRRSNGREKSDVAAALGMARAACAPPQDTTHDE